MQPIYEYVCHIKGHRNSNGELAEWVIKSHETGKILSSHKSEKKAKEHLQQMHIFNEAADGGQREASERTKGFPVIVCADMGMGKTTFVKKINDSGKYKCYDLEVCDLPNIWGEPDEDGNMALVDGWEDIALNKIKSLDADVVAITSDPKMVHKLIESGIPFFLAYKDDISAIRKDIEKRTSEHFANVVKDFWKYIEKSDIPEELKEQMKECDPEAMTNVKCADALPPSIIETDKFQSDDRYRHWHDMFKLKTGGKAVSIMDRNIENLESRLKEFDKITSNLCTKLRLNAGEYLSSPSILHKILDRVDEKEKKSDKLIGESTYGNTMDKRVAIFMESVGQLGLSKNQMEAVGKITKVCLEGSFGPTQEPDDDDIGFVYVSRHGHSALSSLSKMRYADFLKQRDKFASYGDVGPIKKYRMPLIDTEENQAQYVNYDSIPEDTNGNAWGFEYGRKSGFEYISEKYIWLPSDAFDNSVPLEKEGPDVGCIGEISSNSRENILGIRRDKTYDDFLNGYKKARDLATREPDEFKVSKLQRYSTPEFNPLSVKVNHMSFDSIQPDENGNVLGYEEYHRPGHPFQVVTKILWLPANTDEPADETPSDYDIASELYPDDAPTYGRRVSTSEDDYDPDNPNGTDDDMFYDGNGRVNELDPDEELEF